MIFYLGNGALPTRQYGKAWWGVERWHSPGEFHPQALTDPYVTVSRHPTLIIQSPFPAASPYLWHLPSLAEQKARPDDPISSLHLHYKDFNTPANWSAPVLRIGPLALVAPPESEQKQYCDRRLSPLQDPFKIILPCPIKTNEAFSPDHCGAPEVFPST